MIDLVRDAADDRPTPLASATTEAARARVARLSAWLAERTPEPPPSLERRLRELLEEHAAERGALGESETAIADALVDVAEWLLARLLQRECLTRRSSALDLLAADALITYAFEAASEEPERLEARAARAMAALAALVA